MFYVQKDNMRNSKYKLGNFFNSFFYFFGAENNPLEREVKEILKRSHSEKIKGDLKRVNKDYRDSFLKIQMETYSICERSY